MSRIIIMGHGASGKDVLKKRYIDRGFIPDISATTRPPREGEIDGVDYHFISKESLQDMEALNKLVQVQEFNGNHYATLREEWSKKNLFIMTPPGIRDLKPEDRKECFVIYINIDIKTRIERLSERGNTDSEIAERIVADKKTFEGFKDYDLIITDPNF